MQQGEYKSFNQELATSCCVGEVLGWRDSGTKIQVPVDPGSAAPFARDDSDRDVTGIQHHCTPAYFSIRPALPLPVLARREPRHPHLLRYITLTAVVILSTFSESHRPISHRTDITSTQFINGLKRVGFGIWDIMRAIQIREYVKVRVLITLYNVSVY